MAGPNPLRRMCQMRREGDVYHDRTPLTRVDNLSESGPVRGSERTQDPRRESSRKPVGCTSAARRRSSTPQLDRALRFLSSLLRKPSPEDSRDLTRGCFLPRRS